MLRVGAPRGLLFIACLLCTGAFAGFKVRSPGRRGVRQHGSGDRPSIVNCTWGYFNQSLDHNSPGITVDHGSTFPQRYCMYDSFWTPGTGPILLYTGNESPLEEYINNTGLMWELAPKLGALILFAEHRYEGLSVPTEKGVPNCMSYCTSAQALADFAVLTTHVKKQILHAPDVPVIAFGGSYGGMLAAWLRMKYPNVVAGAIAASAPIWGFPMAQAVQFPSLDASSVAISRGVSAAGGATDQCRNNLLNAWPLINSLGKTQFGRAALSSSFQLCNPLKDESDVDSLLDYLQDPWFDMAEGNFPFPSTYITFAVGPGLYPLPAWPLRVACKGLDSDFGIVRTGDVTAVKFDLDVKDIHVSVNWNLTESNNYTAAQLDASGLLPLLEGVREAVAVWYNVTGKLTCFGGDLTAEEAMAKPRTPAQDKASGDQQQSNVCTSSDDSKTQSWGGVTCNEDLNLINYLVRGVGRDMFWPPNVDTRDYTISDLIDTPGSRIGCFDDYAARGLYGVPKARDPWATWLDTFYGGVNIKSASNIVFSNGLLDPWWAGGVLSNVSSSVVALEIPLGAHHLDLFFATKDDPQDVIDARLVEEAHIRTWIADWAK